MMEATFVVSAVLVILTFAGVIVRGARVPRAFGTVEGTPAVARDAETALQFIVDTLPVGQ